MWYLMEEQPDSTPSARYWLGGVSGPSRSIGRKHVDIQLRASSVSRTHARLTVVKGPFYNHPHPVRNTTAVTVYDSSAYGTFLKYPAGHAAHRAAPAHHTRLDKHTPTEISDGARLAFGAPTAWWALVRHPMLIVPSRLSDPECARLADVSEATALDVLATWSPHATHLVTNTFVPVSFKHLVALTAGRPIVTPAFVEAVNHVVVNACGVATASQTASAAEEATRLPDPALFAPPLDKACGQLGAYTKHLPLEPFGRALVEPRRRLLLNAVVAFEREERRAKYAQIVEACGGETMLLSLTPFKTSERPVIFTVVTTPARPGQVPEAALNAAVVAADLGPLHRPAVLVAPAAPPRSASPSPTRTGRKRPAPPSPDGTAADADDTGAKSDDAPDQDASASANVAQPRPPPVYKRNRLAALANATAFPRSTGITYSPKPVSALESRPPKPDVLDADDDFEEGDDDGDEVASNQVSRNRAGHVELAAVRFVANSGAGDAGDANEGGSADGAAGLAVSAEGPSVPAQDASHANDESRYREDDVVIIPQPRRVENVPRRAGQRDARDVRPFRAPVMQRQPPIQVYQYIGLEDEEQEE